MIGVAFGATTVSATEQPVQPAGHTVNPSDPKKDTPAAPSHSEGETGIGYLNLDTLPDGFTGPVKDSSFTGALYIPIVGKDVNCKVRLLDDAGKYTNDYKVTNTTIKALASKVVNGVTFYKVAENRWIPAKFTEVLSDKEVAFKGVAKTFVKGHPNYAVAMMDANGKYTGKFLKQGLNWKVFAKKAINSRVCYRLGTQEQWVPAEFLVFLSTDYVAESVDNAEQYFSAYASEPEVLPAPAVDVLAEAKKVAHEEFTKAGITGKIFHDAIDAAKTVEGLQAYVAETLAAHKTPAVDALAEAKKAAHEEFTKAGITGKIFHDAIDAAKTVEGLQAYVAETLAAHKTPAVDALAEAKKAAHEEFTKAGITGKIFHDAIDAAKTVEGLQAYVAETLAAHKTPAVDALAEAKKAAHKALNDAGITGAIFHKAIDNAKTVEGVKAYVAEFTYHFTYKGAETTVSTDYVAGSVDKAEQYFRAYASESGLNLDFTYDEATHTFVGTDAKPAKTVYHFQYDDKKGNSIRQDFATTDADTAEMHFIAYASDNGLSIDLAHFAYDEATHTFVYKDFESEKGEPEVQPEAPVQKIVFHFQYDDKKGNSIRQDFATTDADTAEMHFIAYASDNGLSIDLAHFAYDEATHTFVYKDFESEKGEPEVQPEAPVVDVLAEAKKVAHEEFTKAGITGKIFHDAIDAAKTVEGLQAYVAETKESSALEAAKKAAHKTLNDAGITGTIFHKAIDAAKTVEGVKAYVAETKESSALEAAKKAAHKTLNDAGITGTIFHKAIDAAKTVEGVKAYVAETKESAKKSALEAAKKNAHETLKKAGIKGDIYNKAIDAAKTVEGLQAYVAEIKESAKKSALEETKQDAHEEIAKAGIKGDIYHKAIDNAKTLEGLQAYVAETLAAHKTPAPKR